MSNTTTTDTVIWAAWATGLAEQAKKVAGRAAEAGTR